MSPKKIAAPLDIDVRVADVRGRRYVDCPGYVRNGERRVSPDPVHAQPIREACEMAAGGEPYARIAAFLTERRVPSCDNSGDTIRQSPLERRQRLREHLMAMRRDERAFVRALLDRALAEVERSSGKRFRRADGLVTDAQSRAYRGFTQCVASRTVARRLSRWVCAYQRDAVPGERRTGPLLRGRCQRGPCGTKRAAPSGKRHGTCATPPCRPSSASQDRRASELR